MARFKTIQDLGKTVAKKLGLDAWTVQNFMYQLSHDLNLEFADVKGLETKLADYPYVEPEDSQTGRLKAAWAAFHRGVRFSDDDIQNAEMTQDARRIADEYSLTDGKLEALYKTLAEIEVAIVPKKPNYIYRAVDLVGVIHAHDDFINRYLFSTYVDKAMPVGAAALRAAPRIR